LWLIAKVLGLWIEERFLGDDGLRLRDDSRVLGVEGKELIVLVGFHKSLIGIVASKYVVDEARVLHLRGVWGKLLVLRILRVLRVLWVLWVLLGLRVAEALSEGLEVGVGWEVIACAYQMVSVSGHSHRHCATLFS
jgi:hypothetical protein